MIDEEKMGQARIIARSVIKINARAVLMKRQLPCGVSFDANNTVLKGKNNTLYNDLTAQVNSAAFEGTLNKIITCELHELGGRIIHPYSYYLSQKPIAGEQKPSFISFRDKMHEAELKLEDLVWIMKE